MESVHVNAREGATEIMLATEECSSRAASNFETNTTALETMLRGVKSVPGIGTLQMSHITMAPVERSVDRRAIDPAHRSFSHVQHKESTDPISA